MSTALAHSRAYIAPASPGLSARSTSRSRVRARVAFTLAKGQKGVRKVVQSGAGALSFNPGSVLSKMMNVTKNKINWKILDDAADKLDGELASQPILGLVRAEVTIRGIDALEREGRGYKEYILLRSLGLKAWFTHATSRAGVHDPLTRCAVGKRLADPDGEFNIYRRVLAHAPAAAAGDWTKFADGLAGDAKAAADALTDDERKTAKNRYDTSVDATAFAAIDDGVKAAAAACARAQRGDDAVATAVAVPWVDPGASPVVDAKSPAGDSPGGDSPGGDSPGEKDGDGEDSVESMFGKKAKKRNKARSAGTGSGAKSVGGALPSLDAMLSQLAKKQQEPTFPEVDAWITKSGQATASEAVATALALCLEAPADAVVVAPSALFASAVSFDTGSLGRGRRIISPGAAASEKTEWGDRAMFVTFEPAAGGGGGDGGMLAKGVAAAAGAGCGVCVVVVALGSGEAAIDAVRTRAKI